jgi:hypothetical protein
VRRTGPILALAMLAWLVSPLGDRPARAMGCHLIDRPALGIDPPGHVAAWELLDRVDDAPPVLTRVPCPGESPQAPIVVTVANGAACPTTATVTPRGPSGLLPSAERQAGIEPPPTRLDRPPRPR